jgi:integrase
MAARPFTKDEITTLRNAYRFRGQTDALLVGIYPDTCLRSGDGLKLNVGDLVEDGIPRETLRVKMEKTGRWTPRMALSDYSRQTIQRYLVGQPLDNPVFVTRRGTRLSGRDLNRHIKRMATESLGLNKEEIENLSSHSFRKYLVSEIVKHEKERGILVARELLGHKDFSVTHRYLGIDQEMALEVASKYL